MQSIDGGCAGCEVPARAGRRAFVFAVSLAALGWAAQAVLAQDGPYPSRPIKAIVPFPAGSAADVTGRIVMERLSQKLGQPVVVENKPGAAGTLGSSYVAHAKPDGYTLLIHSSSHTITGAFYAKLDYDAATDLVGVSPLTYTATAFVTASATGYRTLADLVNGAKARPGGVNFASAGNGSVTHLAGEALKTAGGFQATHIPFKGTGEAMNDLIAGRVDYFLAPVSMVMPFVRNGQLVALATVDTTRSKLLPDVPTTAESGFVNLTFPIWIGLFAPAKTPRPILEKLNAEVNSVLNEPDMRERIERSGASATGMGLAEFSAFLATEFERNAALIKKANLKQ